MITTWISSDKDRARTKLAKVTEAYKMLRNTGKLPDTLLWTDKQRFLWKVVTSYHHLR